MLSQRQTLFDRLGFQMLASNAPVGALDTGSELLIVERDFDYDEEVVATIQAYKQQEATGPSGPQPAPKPRRDLALKVWNPRSCTRSSATQTCQKREVSAHQTRQPLRSFDLARVAARVRSQLEVMAPLSMTPRATLPILGDDGPCPSSPCSDESASLPRGRPR